LGKPAAGDTLCKKEDLKAALGLPDIWGDFGVSSKDKKKKKKVVVDVKPPEQIEH
jgi:DNA-binding transcriptional regulator WhiA